jgi:hypothetical protein
MFKTFLVLVGTLFLIPGIGFAQNLQIGGCVKDPTTRVAPITPTTLNTQYWIFSGGKSIQVQFEADYDGAGTTAEMSTYSCTHKDEILSCEFYDFDSDFDGVPDTHILDGVSAGQRGLEDVKIAGYLMLLVSTAPLTTENPQLWLCGEES